MLGSQRLHTQPLRPKARRQRMPRLIRCRDAPNFNPQNTPDPIVSGDWRRAVAGRSPGRGYGTRKRSHTFPTHFSTLSGQGALLRAAKWSVACPTACCDGIVEQQGNHDGVLGHRGVREGQTVREATRSFGGAVVQLSGFQTQ